MAQATQSGRAAAVDALSVATGAVIEVAKIVQGGARFALATRRIRKAILEIPRWVPWVILGALGLGLLTGFLVGRGRRPAAVAPAADPPPEPPTPD